MRNLLRRSDKERIEHAVEKTRDGSFNRISELFRHTVITDATWEELEELLLQADVGPTATITLVERARDEVSRLNLQTAVEAETALRRQMVDALGQGVHRDLTNLPRGSVVLLTGVNGSGKTTSAAKLTHLIIDRGKSVLLVAADTFRAAAIDQLRIWGERLKVPVIAHQPGADPGAVAFDGVQAARSRGADVVIIDTAGRLHTKFNLMEELQKIKRVIAKVDAQATVISLLVLDATTGQNAILQAREFLKALQVDGIVLAKLDGTAKGGVVFSVYQDLGVPIWYVGTGEQVPDLAPFNHLEFVNALFE